MMHAQGFISYNVRRHRGQGQHAVCNSLLLCVFAVVPHYSNLEVVGIEGGHWSVTLLHTLAAIRIMTALDRNATFSLTSLFSTQASAQRTWSISAELPCVSVLQVNYAVRNFFSTTNCCDNTFYCMFVCNQTQPSRRDGRGSKRCYSKLYTTTREYKQWCYTKHCC
jgi:hypothetical protein